MKLIGNRYLIQVDKKNTTTRKSGLIVHEETDDNETRNYAKGRIVSHNPVVQNSNYCTYNVGDVVYFSTIPYGDVNDTIQIDDANYVVYGDRIFATDD